jgi:excisionase family DNA binding protein
MRDTGREPSRTGMYRRTASLRRTLDTIRFRRAYAGVCSSPERGRQQDRESALPQSTEPRYLRTAQVAELLHVSPKTVSRWAQEGRLPYLRTLGGHRRYPDAEIRALLETLSEPSPAD